MAQSQHLFVIFPLSLRMKIAKVVIKMQQVLTELTDIRSNKLVMAKFLDLA